MHVLLVTAHPEPTSFTAALTATAADALREAGHTVEVSDLYGEGFNPVAGRHDFRETAEPARFHYQTEQGHAHATGTFAPDIAREQERFLRADLVVWLYPIWWGNVPAIVKGWFDRVLAFGFAYADGKRFDTGFFPHKKGLLCLTTGGTRERFSRDGVYGELDQVLWPVQRLMIEYLGMQAQEPFVAYAAPRVDQATRESYLAAWRARILAVAGPAPATASLAAEASPQ